MTRNRLVAYKAQGPWALPPPIRSEHSCRSCMVLPLCTLAHAALEGGTGATFGLPERFAALTAHVTEADAAWLRHWLGLLEMEQREDAVPQAHIWALAPPPVATGAAALPRRHPLAGRCVGHLELRGYEGEADGPALYRFRYTFAQRGGGGDAAAPLAEQGFAAGDACVLSVQDGHAAVNRARVAAVGAAGVTLVCRSRMRALERLCGVAEGGAGNAPPVDTSAHPLWRIDKDEGETVLQCATSALLELAGGTSALLTRLRGLIVHLKPPQRGARDAYAAEVAEEEDCFEQMASDECALLLCFEVQKQAASTCLLGPACSIKPGRLFACISSSFNRSHVRGVALPCRQQATIPQLQAGILQQRRGAAAVKHQAASHGYAGPRRSASAPAPLTGPPPQRAQHVTQPTVRHSSVQPPVQHECAAARQPAPQHVAAATGGPQRSQGAATQTEARSADELLAALTGEQREVVRRVLAWDDYVLCMGLPGSGKTSTICALAQVFAAASPPDPHPRCNASNMYCLHVSQRHSVLTDGRVCRCWRRAAARCSSPHTPTPRSTTSSCAFSTPV